MTLVGAVAAQADLVDFDADEVFGQAGQAAAVPDGARHHQVAAVQRLDAAAQKQRRDR